MGAFGGHTTYLLPCMPQPHPFKFPEIECMRDGVHERWKDVICLLDNVDDDSSIVGFENWGRA